MSDRALITGISGFVGGFLAEHLLDCGDAVLGASPNGRWLPESDPTLAERVELIAWNLAEQDGLSETSRRRIERFRPNAIYHLAALSVPEDCGREEPTDLAIAVNVAGTRRVLDMAASLQWLVKVLFISSSQVYAPVESGSHHIDENAPLAPAGAYGKTKLAAETSVRDARDIQNLVPIIARSFQHAGPRQDPRLMLSAWARQFAAAGSEPVEVHTLDARIDLTDVRDVVRAYRLLIQHGHRGEAYNVGSGIERSSGEVLAMLRDLADPARPIHVTRPGFRGNPTANITRLVTTTGWKPVIPVEKTVADTLHWWQHDQGKRGRVHGS